MQRCVIVALIGLLLGAGCSTPRPVRDVRNPDPLGKIPAIKEAVREKDRSAVRQLVKDLDSDDAAVRLFAIIGLRRLTGQTFDYRYYDDPRERRPAVQRWEQWLAGLERDDDGQHDGQQDARRDNGGATDAPDHASGP